MVFLLSLSGNCSTVTCDRGATCKVVRGGAKCECDFSCTGTRTPVCGSDLQTYDNECKMKEAACIAKKDISVLVRDNCGELVHFEEIFLFFCQLKLLVFL